MILGLYRLVDLLGGPVITCYLRRRLASGKEDAARFQERLGLASHPRPSGPLIWFHAASVGEALSVLPLMRAVRGANPTATLLLTTGTVTSATIVADRLPDGCLHHYIPVDRRAYVRRFLDHWKPDLAVWAESELWPHLTLETKARGVPMVLLNGRMSPRSFAKWSRFPDTAATLLAAFDCILTQTQEDAERFRALGATQPRVAGNLKFAADPLPIAPDALDALKSAIGPRPVWLAASSWAGEEELAWQAHQILAQSLPSALTIIVPRHPNRGPEIADGLRASGARVSQRSLGEPISNDTQILLADTMGELGLFFHLAPVVFIGKSLTAEGGQNPLEAARLNCAILFGPRMSNFEEIANEMIASGAALQVETATFSGHLCALMTDGETGAQMSAAALAFAQDHATVMASLLEQLTPFFPKISGARP